MPLDKTTLQAAIKQAFQKAKDTPPPSDPAQSDPVQAQILEHLSQDLANAVEAYLLGGDISGAAVDVFNLGSVKIGTGSQTNTIHVH